jgi:hypothetical protein
VRQGRRPIYATRMRMRGTSGPTDARGASGTRTPGDGVWTAGSCVGRYGGVAFPASSACARRGERQPWRAGPRAACARGHRGAGRGARRWHAAAARPDARWPAGNSNRPC